MRVLVTGGSGFVGLNIVEAFLNRGHDVTLTDVNEAPPAARSSFGCLPGRLRMGRLDVTESRAVAKCIAEVAPDLVVHAAALAPGATNELATSTRTVAINVGGAMNVLEAVREANVKRLVSIGSAAVYGRAAPAAKFLDEGATPQPNQIYGITKLAAERIALRYRAIAGMDVICVRIGSVFGPWEWETGTRDTLSPMLQALNLHSKGKCAILSRPGRRDWIYGREVGSAVASIAESTALGHELYNIASGTQWSIADWCEEVSRNLPSFQWRLAEDGEAGNIDLFAAIDRPPLCIARLSGEIGIEHRRDMRDVVSDHLAWVSNNPGFPTS